jgi:hypothetical protein
MTKQISKMVLGVFSDEEDATSAIKELDGAGFNPKDISIVMKDKHGHVHEETGVGEGLVSGATTGGILGALAGLAIGVGAFTIPGVGAFLFGGPIAAALGLTGAAATTVSGAVTGAVAGGILGALVGLGVPEEDARVYEESINQGGILVAVPAKEGDEQDAADILTSFNADQVKVITSSDTYTESPRMEEERPAYFSEVRRKRR